MDDFRPKLRVTKKAFKRKCVRDLPYHDDFHLGNYMRWLKFKRGEI